MGPKIFYVVIELKYPITVNTLKYPNLQIIYLILTFIQASTAKKLTEMRNLAGKVWKRKMRHNTRITLFFSTLPPTNLSLPIFSATKQNKNKKWKQLLIVYKTNKKNRVKTPQHWPELHKKQKKKEKKNTNPFSHTHIQTRIRNSKNQNYQKKKKKWWQRERERTWGTWMGWLSSPGVISSAGAWSLTNFT